MSLDTAGDTHSLSQSSNSEVLVVGIGAAFHEHLRDVGAAVNAQRLTVVDLKTISGEFPPDCRKLRGDINDPTFIAEQLAFRDRAQVVVLIATNDHLANFASLAAAGFRRFIIEKPLVNNSREGGHLAAILEQHPDIRVYPIDFYLQKAIPLLALCGALPSRQSAQSLLELIPVGVDSVSSSPFSPFPNALFGALSDQIGKVEGITVNISEGGKLGVPDLISRPWLHNDPVRGGMLLDLGTHALLPLLTSGLVDPDSIRVELAHRERLDLTTGLWSPARPGEVETSAHAFLSAQAGDRRIGIDMIVRKAAQDGGAWLLDIRGSKGSARLGLRSGDRLDVSPKDAAPFGVRLKPGSSAYQIALSQGAEELRRETIITNSPVGIALKAISLLDEIRRVADHRWMH